MKSCSVPLCANDSNKRPDLKYFALPRNVNIREEWLEVIGVKGNYRGQNLSICENHFSDLDFKAGKKELKAHAVPVVDVGVDEGVFILDVSDCRPEVMEIVQTEEVSNEQTTPASTKKKSSSEEKPLLEPTPEIFQEGRRPSRRAAVEAAKKIFNTVRNYNIKELHAPEEVPSQPPPPKAPATPSSDKKVKKMRRNYDLDMYCEEEQLSAIQSTCQHDAQNSFNLAMKNMRELTTCDVRVTQTGPNPVDFNVSVNVFADDVKTKQKNSSRPLSKSHVPNVYPVFLTKVSNLSKTPIIYV